jgi:hypothetical protein
MSWFKTGYESTETAYDDLPSSGPSRVWMPEDTTRRFLFLDDEPTCFWEHQFQANGTWKNWEPCKTRNKMENVCAICDRFPDRYASYLGYHTVMSLTPWTDDKGRTWCFGRQMYGAKLGGKDKPGVLKKLKRLKAKHGHMRGLIIDAYRSGAKTESVGDELDVVEVIDPAAVVAWVKSQLPAHIEKINEGREPGKEMTLEKFLKINPIEPFNFEEIIKPRSNADLLSMLGGPSSATSTSSSASSADEVDSALDEDIPY